MPITSYAQNFEDVLLWRALRHVGGGFYIDIGAQDPVFDSVSKGFYEQGWRGIHVEPALRYAERLREDRPDETVVHAAVSDRAGMLKFYDFHETGLSTALKRVADIHRHRGFEVVETLVSAVTLDQIFANIESEEIHWLKIDVEGFERAVLKGWRKSRYRPWIVVVEAVDPLTQTEGYQEWEPLLAAKGYSFVYFDGLNRYYLSAAHKKLKKHFHYGPALWDEFQLPEISRPTHAVAVRHKEALERLRVEAEAKIAQQCDVAARAQTDIVELNNALSDARTALGQARSECEQTQGDLDWTLGETKAELDQMRRSLDDARAELGVREGEFSQVRDALHQAQGEVGQTREVLHQTQSELSQIRGELHQAQGELSQTRGALNQTRVTLDRTRAELNQTRNELSDTRGDLKRSVGELRQARSELDENRGELKKIRGELDRTRSQLDDTQRALNQTSDVLARSQTEVEQKRREADQASRAANRVLDDLKQVRATLEQTRSDQHQTRNELEQKRAALAQMGAEMRRAAESWSRQRGHLAAELEVVTGSLWWRISVPFRQPPAALAVLATEIVTNREFGADDGGTPIAGSLDDLLVLDGEAFVRSAYLTLLGRDADPEGLRYYLGRLLLGASRQTIAAELSVSPEGRVFGVKLPGLEALVRHYRVLKTPLLGPLLRLLGIKEKDRQAFRFLQLGPITGVGSGQTVTSAAELLSMHDESFVRSAYATLLGRDPDSDGLSNYLSRVRSGDSRREIVAEISLSPEGRARTHDLAGLDKVIRPYRRRRLPLIGPVLRLLNPIREREDLPRKLAAIESQLDLLARLGAPTAAHVSAVADGPSPSRVGWVTTWNVKCGIAATTRHLLETVPADDVFIFAARQHPQIRPDEPNCLRAWDPGKDANGLDAILRESEPRGIRALVIQFNYGFFNHFELNDFIEAAAAHGIVVMIDLHSTTDPPGARRNFRLADLLLGLQKCHRVLAHSQMDISRLTALGLTDNVSLFPLGVVNRRIEPKQARKPGARPLIASFGFCLPNKGLPELVEAVGLLKQDGKPVYLRMLNAQHPAPESADELEKVKQSIQRLGLQDDVELRSDFLDDDVCLALLGEADLVVNPYQQTGESASLSVRQGLTTGRPVAVTPLPIFDDLGDAAFRLPGTTPAEIAQGIAGALEDIEAKSEKAERVQREARRWVETHDFARQGVQLVRIARTFVRRQASVKTMHGGV